MSLTRTGSRPLIRTESESSLSTIVAQDFGNDSSLEITLSRVLPKQNKFAHIRARNMASESVTIKK